ncbi:MAG TPA: NAD(P)H-hydrate dehydratase [Rhizomicrobium sp.]|nr:NAD(P)H-hydrate dehydratase [Rhizomicrobium sp.]
MASEILTVGQCYEADTFAAAHGVPALALMENAGRAVADEICRRFTPRPVAVLCGPGNNGGDGFVVARILAERGWSVVVETLGDAHARGGDAADVARRWTGTAVPLAPGASHAALYVDALFGAGLSRALEGEARRFAEWSRPFRSSVVAIDVPSGLHGDTGRPLGDLCVHAGLTVTFFRKKPAHVLMPGRDLCGEVVVADIGIPEAAIGAIEPDLFENGPGLWVADYPWPRAQGHKYARGHCVVVSGPMHATGAARLAAQAALRIGAGLVSVASPPGAVEVNAAHLTAVMIKPFSGAAGLADLLKDRRFNSVVIGPGAGVGQETREMVAAVLATEAAAVLDADALTSFRDDPAALFRLLREPCVLTPHEGEFERIFKGDLAKAQNKVEAARAAAAIANCTVLLKGPDTAIAAPRGRATVNSHAPPALATAGSGDVLAGFIGGLMAQGLESFRAAEAAAWLHGEAAFRFGPGLISEDLAGVVPAVLRDLKDLKDPLNERHLDTPRGEG